MNSRAKRLQLASILTMGLAGLGFGYGIGRLMKLKGAVLPFSGPEFIAMLPGIFFAVIVIHELGHAIAGWMNGYQLRLFAAGPLRIERDGKGLRPRFNRSPAMWGGLAALTPPASISRDMDKLRRSMLILVSGGPLASLLSAVALWPAWIYQDSDPAWACVLAIFGFLSLTIAAATLIPRRLGGYNSDGRRMLDLLSDSPGADRWCALASLGANAHTERPRDWPAGLVEKVTELQDESPDRVSGAWMRHTWHLDRKEISEAERWLNVALENLHHWPSAAQGAIHANAAYFYARHRHDAVKARDYLNSIRQAEMLPPETRLLAEAAVLQAEGNCSLALSVAEKGRNTNSHKGSVAGMAIDEYFADIQRLAHS